MTFRATVQCFITACLILFLNSPLFGGKPSESGNADYERFPTESKTTTSGPEGTELLQGNILTLTVQDAVLLALEHNGSLIVEHIKTSIDKTYEKEELGVFDPVLSGDLSYSAGEGTSGTNDSGRGSVGAGVSFPFTTGTEIGGGLGISAGDEVSLELSVDLSQELLKGGRRAANLAKVKQAELDSFSSEFELRGFTEALVASVENAYWDFLSAESEVEIYREGLLLADQQFVEIRERVSVGSIPGIELVASQAEVALRRKALLDAESRLERARLRILYLLNFPGDNLWEAQIVPSERPEIPSGGIDELQSHLESAIRMRPDLNQALLAKRHGELEVVKTKNGLLPRLDLFISMGKTGYSESFSGTALGLGEDGLDFDASLTFSYPIGNRQNRAQYNRALLTSRQAEVALENLKRLVELDVRSAYVEARSTREQIDTTVASRTLQEEKLKAEMEKFRVGRSTALLVAQSQRDLLDSMIAEEEALIGYLKSLINLYRQDGSLLLRRGIAVPSGSPVEEPAWLP
jgi:outer membrane protein